MTSDLHARRDLQAKALWHQQVNASKVAVLAFAAGTDAIWCGCDAAAPRLGSTSGEQAPLVLVSCKDGTTLRSASGMPVCNVRLLHTLGKDKELLCTTGDGALLTLDAAEGAETARLCSCAALPGMPAAGAAAQAGPTTPAPADTSKTKTQEASADQRAAVPASEVMQREPVVCGSEQEQGQEAAVVSGALAGPEFMPEAGYRGHKEGYLFREGGKGVGYYRKDVVRRYCASALVDLPVGPARGSGAAAPQSAAAKTAGPSGVGSATLDALQQGGPPLDSSDQEQEGQEATQDAEEVRLYIQRMVKAPPSMHSVLLSHNGSLLFTSSLGPTDCSVRVWRLGKRVQDDSCKGSSDASGSGSGTPAALGADGSLGPKASTSSLQPAELYRTLTGHSAPVLSLALTSDGKLLLTGSYDQTVRVWCTADWHCVRVLKGHGGGVRALAVAPDGSTLYSAAADNTIRAWSMQHWVCLRTMHGRHDDTTWPACLALSPDGSLLASGSTGPFGASTIKVFKTSGGLGHEAGACLVSFAQLQFNQKAGMTALLFSPDGGVLYSGASDGTLAAWELTWQAKQGPGGSAVGLRRGFL